MKTINKILLGSLLATTSSIALANGDGSTGTWQTAATPWWHGVFVGVEGGMSISTKMNFAPDYSGAPNVPWKLPTFQDPDFWKTDMGTAPLFGAKIGYFFNPQLALDLSYDYRGNFKWHRAASLPTGDWTTEAMDYGTDNIHSNDILLNARFFPKVNWGNLKPFIGAGAGIAMNYVDTVVEKTLSSGNPKPERDELSTKTTTSFAWQVGAGFDYAFTDNVNLTLGYRFVDLGKLESGGHIAYSTDPEQFGGGVTPLKENNVFLNEAYLSLNYKF